MSAELAAVIRQARFNARDPRVSIVGRRGPPMESGWSEAT
jgi:hypothetical protein